MSDYPYWPEVAWRLGIVLAVMAVIVGPFWIHGHRKRKAEAADRRELNARAEQARHDTSRASALAVGHDSLRRTVDSLHDRRAHVCGDGVVEVVAWAVSTDPSLRCHNVSCVHPNGTQRLEPGQAAFHSVAGTIHDGELRQCQVEACLDAWLYASTGSIQAHCGVPGCPKYLVPAPPEKITSAKIADVPLTFAGVASAKLSHTRGGYPSKVDPPSALPKVDVGPAPGARHTKGDLIEGITWVKLDPDAIHSGPAPAAEPDEEWPDPDKADCTVWLPQDKTVPYTDRTPCRLDLGHDGDHEPANPSVVDRSTAILARLDLMRPGTEWETAAKNVDEGGCPCKDPDCPFGRHFPKVVTG